MRKDPVLHSFETTGARMKAMSKWKYLALHHELTQLPNRRMLQMSMKSYMEKAVRKRERLAVVFVDIDRFKEINDVFGHMVGDAFLVEVANRLAELSIQQPAIHPFHLSGDEFVLLIEDSYFIMENIQLVQNVFSRPFYLKETEVRIGATMGISLYPDHSRDENQLLEFADLALYKAKASVENRCYLYEVKGEEQ